MKKILIMLFLFLVSCGGGQQAKPIEEQKNQEPKKEDTPKQVVVKDQKEETYKAFEIQMNDNNKRLEKSSIEQFKLGSSEIPKNQWEKWAKKAAPIVKEILKMMPEGYVLEIVGHTDATGNDEVNEKLSESRAKAVFEALEKEGIKSNKIVYVGVSSKDMIKGISSSDSKQRRVSFRVVKK